MKYYNVAVVGATGAVGEEMTRILEQRGFPVKKLSLYASHRSAGKEYLFKETIRVEELKMTHSRIDIALFSGGDEVSKHFAPLANTIRCCSHR